MNIARVLRAHGKEGEVAVRPVRGLPLLLEPGMRAALTPPALDRDRFCTVEAVEGRGDDALVRFSGIDTIGAAEALAGCYVLVERASVELDPLSAPYTELIGRAVCDERFGELGRISEIMETPANDVWVVEGERYGEVLIPVVPSVVPGIPETGPIAVRVMDGLIDPERLKGRP